MCLCSIITESKDRVLKWDSKALTESSYGGDLRSSAVVGQSAGAQLAAMLLLRQCRREEEDLEGEEDENG